jgi:hypothetical protein
MLEPYEGKLSRTVLRGERGRKAPDPLGVKEIEDTCRKELEENGRTVIGTAGLFAVDPRDRPKNPKKSGHDLRINVKN